ncbi:MAG TPA: serine hydrolase domain-containing protein [Candidatus Binatia bacterium]|nr:serine hydrolase domain-containing protein [Candidatus Binatia bacterium]
MRPTRTRDGRRTPFFALLLSLLALLAPDLTLAPLQAGERSVEAPAPRLLEELALPARSGIRAAARSGTPADSRRYEAAVEATRAAAGARGISFAAVRDGQLLWAGASSARGDGPVIAPSSQLVIGSVTKTFVAAAILQLAEEGRLRLDDPAGQHLPPSADPGAGITVAQLLDHTSGLADLFNETTRTGIEEHPERGWTPEEVLATLHPPWYAPGEGWAYANTNYYLLGLIVERLGGAPLADELHRRFLDPLGLEATSVLTGAAGSLLQPAWTTIFWASGAMSASAADLARWGDALYGGAVLRPETLAAMLRVNDHGYGYGVQRIEVGGVAGHGHTGLLHTDTTLLVHLPGDGLTIAVLAHRSDGDLAGALTARPPDGGPTLLELARGQ